MIRYAAAAALALLAAPSLAAAGPLAPEDAAALEPNGFVWQDAPAAGAMSIVVSIPDQRAYVYRGERLVAISTVSTGKEGKETPVGEFAVLQKAAMHRSNLYDAAPMPYMQRLTWDGVAIHAGANPGFPASHGCIRVPTAFAKRLFAASRVGTSVSVLDTSLDGAPVPQTLEAVTEASAEETRAANETQLAVVEKP